MLIPVTSIDDPRISIFRSLKDRELAAMGGLFIAEGEHVVRRLLASRYEVAAVLLARRRRDEMAPLVPDQVPVFVVSDELIHGVVGFKFHSGILAAGRRPLPRSIDDVLPREVSRCTLMILPEIATTDNLGSLIRIAAGFGVDAMILGERSCDPFFRQSIRVSMGTIFSLPLVHSSNITEDLRRLREQWRVELAATVLDEQAEALSGATRPARFALLFGNEAQGLDPSHVALCDRQLTIPMNLGTDSLNVAVAAGIFLYQFTSPMSFAEADRRQRPETP
jgi:tRNA G18 (ribose-2'-O)-methylase SpoU